MRPRLLILSLAPVCAVSAQAGNPVGATEFTQLANNMELAASYSEHLRHTIQQQEMIVHQLNAFQLQLQNTKKLDGLNWSNASGVLNQLAKNLKTANGIAYVFATEDAAFKALHKDYVEFTKREYKTADLTAIYGQWARFNADAAGRAAKAAGIAVADAESEEARVSALKVAGASAEGQLQAVMAGNALSAELLDQMRVLKQLLAQQIEAEARYKLIEQEALNRETAHDAAVMDDSDDDCTNAKGYGRMK